MKSTLLLCLWLVSGLVAAAKDAWVRVETPKFILFAETEETAAMRWAVEFEQFRGAMGKIFNVQPAALRPVTVMLFKSARSMRAYLPPAIGNRQLAGFFAQSLQHPVIGLADADADEATRGAIFHEAVHWYMSARTQLLPLCIEEGVAEAYSTFSVKGDRFSTGDPIAWHLRTLRDKGLMPLESFLEVNVRSKNYNDQERATQFYAQAWLFAHYNFFRQGGDNGGQLARFLALRKRGTPAEDAVRGAFDCDFKQLEKRLMDYATDGVFVSRGGKVDRAEIERGIHSRPATPVEVDLALGTLLIAGGNSEKGEGVLTRTAQAAPDNPAVWQALAEAAIMRNDPTAAANHYERAVALGCKDARAYIVVARSKVPSVVGGAAPSAGNARESADLCHRALALAGDDADAYDLLASLAGMLDPITPEDLAALQRASQLRPEDGLVAVGLGSAEIRSGMEAEGQARLEDWLGRAGALKPNEERYARNLLSAQRWTTLKADVDRLVAKDDWATAIARVDGAVIEGDFSAHQKKELATQRVTLWQMQKSVELRGLLAERRFSEAVELAQALNDEPPVAALRPALKQALAVATAGLEVTQAAELIGRRDYAEARRLLNTARARTLPSPVVREIDRLLGRIDQAEMAARER